MSIGSWIMSILKVALLVLGVFHSGYQNLRKEMQLILLSTRTTQLHGCWWQSEESLQHMRQLLLRRFILKGRKWLRSITSSKGAMAIRNTDVKDLYIILVHCLILTWEVLLSRQYYSLCYHLFFSFSVYRVFQMLFLKVFSALQKWYPIWLILYHICSKKHSEKWLNCSFWKKILSAMLKRQGRLVWLRSAP